LSAAAVVFDNEAHIRGNTSYQRSGGLGVKHGLGDSTDYDAAFFQEAE
jgi:hypothetical protein